MWYDEVSKSWFVEMWGEDTICGRCHGIRPVYDKCQVCGDPEPSFEPLNMNINGQEVLVSPAFPGAEGRYEDWIYLSAIEREWKRPVVDDDRFPGAPLDIGPSPQAAVIILFWSYFETRIERLLRSGLNEMPERQLNNLLRRYSTISARMQKGYQVAFASTYKEDLESLGFNDVWEHLAKVQNQRNSFAHGQPRAIDDALVQSTVAMLKKEHEAWVAVFNKRAARP